MNHSWTASNLIHELTYESNLVHKCSHEIVHDFTHKSSLDCELTHEAARDT